MFENIKKRFHPDKIPESDLIFVFLLVTSLCVLVKAPGYLSGSAPLGDDSSSHIVAVHYLIDCLKNGEFRLWNPALNLGYPLIHFYQPVSYIVTALTAILIGGPHAAVTAYKIWVVIILILIPYSYFYSFTRLSLGYRTALLGGLIAGTISSKIDFGLACSSFLFQGLYSHLFGALFLPLAFAECVRFIRGDGRLTLAAASLTMLYFSHSFMGTALIPLLVLAGLICGNRGKLFGRLKRLCVLGIIFFVFTAFWTIPMLYTLQYMGGWPWVSETHMHGIGIKQFLVQFLSGELTDYRRLPILLGLCVVGLFVIQVNFVKNHVYRMIGSGFLMTICFLAGRTSFGEIVNWVYPPNMTLPLERYICMFDFFVILLAAIGGGWCVERLQLHFKFGSALAFFILFQISLPSLVIWNTILENGLKTRFQQDDRSKEASFYNINKKLYEQSDAGRYFTHRGLGLGNHWDMYLPALYSGKPGGVSYGSGYHDSLNFYFMDQIQFNETRQSQKLARLYNIRYLISSPDKNLDFISSEIVAVNDHYVLRKLDGDYGYFELIHTPRVLDIGGPRLTRPVVQTWFKDDYWQSETFLRRSVPVRPSFHASPGDPTLGVVADPEFSIVDDRVASSGDLGGIVAEKSTNWSYACQANVLTKDSWLILKASVHPFWQATIDGEEVDIYQVSPAIMGIRIPAGKHEILFEYSNPTYQKVLLAASLCIFVVIVMIEWRCSGRAKRLLS